MHAVRLSAISVSSNPRPQALALTVLAHAAALWLLVSLAPSPELVRRAATAISVSLMPAEFAPTPVAEPRLAGRSIPSPGAVTNQRAADTPQTAAAVAAVGLMASMASSADAAADLAVDLAAMAASPAAGAAQPTAQMTPVQPSAQPPSFDADYLANPAPAYPSLSRRAGEQGSVLLQVQVTAEGLVARVSVTRSSGFPRLDAAALEAVRHWRFVPARQGTRAVDGWVLVPINFLLKG